MQRERGAIGSFPETIDLNQGSLQNSTSMDQSDSWDTMLNPVETRLPNASNDHTPSFSFWDRGESSSGTRNIQNGDDSKTRLGYSYASSTSNIRPEDWSFEPSSSSSYSTRTNMHDSSNGYFRESSPMAYASSSNVGAENNDGSNPSFSNWGSSCKRKALEGTSEPLYSGGSSSAIPPVPTGYPAPQNLSIPSGTPNLHLNPSGANNVPPVSFPSSSVGESSARNFSIRSDHGRLNSVPSDTSIRTSGRHFGINPPQLSRPVPNTDSSELRLRMAAPHMMSSSLNRPHLGHVNEAMEMHSYLGDGSYGSRGGSSSSSLMTSGVREESSNVRSSVRNNLNYHTVASAPETRNIPQDHIDWSFAPRTSTSSLNQSSVPYGSGGWLPHENQVSPNHQQVSEPAPWVPFPHAEHETGNRRRHFAILPSASSSSDEAASSGRSQHLLRRSSAAAFLMDIPGDDGNSWRSLSAVEGRHRLIRQVLNAMRRGGTNLQAEDYMFMDPFLHGIAELQDRHRDMRLDVDNMSYEELLALEERIGNVSTGLSEEKITGFMKQRKHEMMIGNSRNLEPCCVCQENYVARDDIGILDCGHEFHAVCIKKWLAVKNICPICKTTALET